MKDLKKLIRPCTFLALLSTEHYCCDVVSSLPAAAANKLISSEASSFFLVTDVGAVASSVWPSDVLKVTVDVKSQYYSSLLQMLAADLLFTLHSSIPFAHRIPFATSNSFTTGNPKTNHQIMAFSQVILLPSANWRSPSTFFYRLFSNETFSTSSLSALVRPITVRTCVGLYPKLVRLNPKLYAAAKGNTEGIDLTVDYLDTALLHSKDSFLGSSSLESSFLESSSRKFSTSSSPPHQQKTILAIPGTGGHYGNYRSLVEHFSDRPEVRLLAPNLPDFSHTRTGGRVFWHSNAELVAFLRDFLVKLEVRTVDVALCHSMGVHRLLELFSAEHRLSIRSAAFFGAQPLYDLQEKHITLMKRFFFTLRNETFYNFLGAIRLHRLPIIPVHYEHVNDALLFAVQSLHASRAKADLSRNIDHLSKLSLERSIPVTILYGTKEKFISRQAMDRFFTAFGLKVPEEVLFVDPEVDSGGEVIVNSYGSNQPRVKGVLLKGGGHFAFANYPDITNRIVEDLLRRSEDAR